MGGIHAAANTPEGFERPEDDFQKPQATLSLLKASRKGPQKPKRAYKASNTFEKMKNVKGNLTPEMVLKSFTFEMISGASRRFQNISTLSGWPCASWQAICFFWKRLKALATSEGRANHEGVLRGFGKLWDAITHERSFRGVEKPGIVNIQESLRRTVQNSPRACSTVLHFLALQTIEAFDKHCGHLGQSRS